MYTTIKHFFGKFFGRFGREENGFGKLHSVEVVAAPSPAIDKIKTPKMRPSRVEVNAPLPVVVSKRRRKQQHKMVSGFAPISPARTAATNRALRDFLAIESLFPEKWGRREVDCLKEMLFWFWRTEAIGGGYRRFRSLKKNVLEDFYESEFSVCFQWLNKTGLILWHIKAGRERLISLCLKSRDAQTRQLCSAILRAYREMNSAVRR